MSTQKRVSRSPRATGCCREARFRRQRMSCTERAGGRGSLAPPSIARFGCAVVGGLTASLLSILWSIRAWFLPSDEHLSPGAPLEPPGRIGPIRSAAGLFGGSFPPYLVLLRVGFTMPPALPPERCALTAPFHPYPGTRRAANSLEADRPGNTLHKKG